jgi:hypothetical protein
VGKADLLGASLQNAQLSRLRLEEADLSGAQLNWARLFSCHARRADLLGASLQGAHLFWVRLEEADLSGVQFKEALLVWVDLRMVKLLGASLRDAMLFWVWLQGADLSYADLRDAQLSRTYLEGANLSGAQLQGANLSGAKGLTEEQLAAATGNARTKLPHGVRRHRHGQPLEARHEGQQDRHHKPGLILSPPPLVVRHGRTLGGALRGPLRLAGAAPGVRLPVDNSVVVAVRSTSQLAACGLSRLVQSQRGCPGSPWSFDQYRWFGVEIS